jgi:hypothetical protein
MTHPTRSPAPDGPGPSSHALAGEVHSLWESGQLPRVKPTIPAALPHLACAPPLRAGPDRLLALFKRFLQRLSPEQREDLIAWAQHECPQPLQVGTVCSGTDMPLLCWGAFARALREDCGVCFSVQACFAAEIDPKKRDFLKRMFPELQLLIESSSLLCDSEAPNLMDPEQKCAPVPSPHHLPQHTARPQQPQQQHDTSAAAAAQKGDHQQHTARPQQPQQQRRRATHQPQQQRSSSAEGRPQSAYSTKVSYSMRPQKPAGL